MRAKRKRRLLIAGLLAVGISTAVGLTLLALQQNINLFFSPSQIVAGQAPAQAHFRIGGMVVAGSVKRNQTDLKVMFDLTDTAATVAVSYAGILPDLFREGQGIVALGAMRDGVFVASQVLAKHDETYMPPPVSDALKAASKKPYPAAANPVAKATAATKTTDNPQAQSQSQATAN
ncbi:cytochrome c maturation protein CcmE [Candidatus Spongiihabitans sp.]|uniref:cytochrome c maturation protein CcmE n=1 Tax=Candidatus Spongiihabitans sp. TaxID=3101308 RepID=UPI003C7CEAE8